MLSIIIGAIMVVFISIFCEIRIGIEKTENESLRDMIKSQNKEIDKRNALIKELADNSSDLLDDYFALMDIMREKINCDEIEELINEKYKLDKYE